LHTENTKANQDTTQHSTNSTGAALGTALRKPLAWEGSAFTTFGIRLSLTWSSVAFPLGTIQAFVGHMSPRMLKPYTHITSGAARRIVKLLDADPILIPAKQASERVYPA